MGAAGTWGETTGGDLVGQTVYGINGEEIGEIQDVVTRQGTTSPEALVGVGGFLGIGERNVAIPLSQIRKDGDRLVTTHSKESLGAMQAYEQSGYSAWDRSQRVGTGTGQ
jgi:sporulation protein YlmC with PRC-barrel domain